MQKKYVKLKVRKLILIRGYNSRRKKSSIENSKRSTILTQISLQKELILERMK